MEYFAELARFLAQAQTGNLKTSHFAAEADGLKIKISFGKGNPARVPWIAFLADGQHISNGIYPFYVFYKSQQLLVLAFGISETLPPKIPWHQQSAETIQAYFKNHGLGKPVKYGSSLVFRVYDIGQLDQMQADADLTALIDIYRQTIGNAQSGGTIEAQSLVRYQPFYERSLECGLHIGSDLVIRFIAALLAKPFVILTGLSGAGKTQLAQAFAKWICESDDQVCLVAVGADWTNREPLLGFPNALDPERYVMPESGVVDLLLMATGNPGRPYFLILDEMNLSHVERYFADFLSGMESGQGIRMHSGQHRNSEGVPARLPFPSNLFIIGTVNIDETTYMFSPKVLDRANVIEFAISWRQMEMFLRSENRPELWKLAGKGANAAAAFVEMAKDRSPESKFKASISNELVEFFKILKQAGAEFGYRSASEILRFAAFVNHLEPEWPLQKVMDAAIMQKLLPKIHGSRRKLDAILKALGRKCLGDPDLLEDFLSYKKEMEGLGAVHYPMTLEKLRKIYKNLIDHGFASYAEA